MLVVVRADDMLYRELQGRLGDLARAVVRSGITIGEIGPLLAKDLDRRGVEQIIAVSATGEIGRMMLALFDQLLWIAPGSNSVGGLRCDHGLCAPPGDWRARPAATVLAHAFPPSRGAMALFLAATRRLAAELMAPNDLKDGGNG